jgi:hypothetical protein
MGVELTGERLRITTGGGAAAATGTVLLTDYTAKGMILAGSAANAPTGLAIAGTTGYYLVADSASVTGLKWSAPAGGGDLKADGTVPLSANWDVGAFKITLETLTSDVASGTAPFTVTSTTLVSNLNADKLDGIEGNTLCSTGTYAAHTTATGVHGVAQVAGTADITTHAGLTATHGAGTILSVSAATVLITTHASSTDAHIGGAGTVLSNAAGTVLITTHASSTDAHIGGAGTVLSVAAATALITTHSGSTAVHGAGTVASVAAATALITTHASSTDAHIGGAGTVCSVAAATALIQTHTALTTGIHGIGTIAAAASTDYYKVSSTIQMGEVGLYLDAALSAESTYCGIVEAGTTNETLLFGNVCYLTAASTRWGKALATAATTSCQKLGVCVSAATAAASTLMLLWGKVKCDTLFPTLTVGAPIYIDAGTAGYVAGTISSGTTNYVTRIVGYGNAADELYFHPDNTYIEAV